MGRKGSDPEAAGTRRESSSEVHFGWVLGGRADIYRFVAGTALGKETPESRDKARGGQDVVRLLSQERSR